MPFAGIIQPEVGAADNFNHCMGAMSKQVLKLPLDTIQHILNQFTGLLKNVSEKLHIFRGLRQRIGLTMMSMMTLTMGKMSGLVSVLVGNLHKIRDLIKRIIGTGTLAS
jgi:glycerol-3-phosphate dehydrogenase